MRDTNRAAAREWPPTRKKLSLTPNSPWPSTSAQIAWSWRSRSVEGSTRCCRSPAKDGAGRALRSSLPFVVSGRASSSTNAAGTM